MKLIIDIPEEAKRHIDTFKGKFLCGDGFDLIEAIQNGTPLDDVKADITKAYDDVTMYSCDEQVSRFASIVCGILNRIGKAESEDKE